MQPESIFPLARLDLEAVRPDGFEVKPCYREDARNLIEKAVQLLFVSLFGFIYTNKYNNRTKYAIIVSKIVYIRMSNTGDQCAGTNPNHG